MMGRDFPTDRVPRTEISCGQATLIINLELKSQIHNRFYIYYIYIGHSMRNLHPTNFFRKKCFVAFYDQK